MVKKSKLMYMALIVLSIILLSEFIVSINITPAKATNGWLDGFTYRKLHEITGSSGAGYDYQLYFKVYRANGTDSGSEVYLAGNCKTDFSDVRFADMTTQPTVFPMWKMKLVPNEYAEFWVKLTTVDLNNNQTIALYYGNDNATDISSFDSTFPFGETWSSSTLNSTKWQNDTNTGWGIDPVNHFLEISSPTGIHSLNFTTSMPSVWKLESAYSTNPITMYLYHSNNDYSEQSSFTLGPNSVVWHRYSDPAYSSNAISGVGIGAIDYSDLIQSSQRTVTVSAYKNASEYVFVYRDGLLRSTKQNTGTIGQVDMNRASGGGTFTTRWYDFKIRKYVPIEPSHGAWQTAEIHSGESSGNIAVFWNTGGSRVYINDVAATINGSIIRADGAVTISAIVKNSNYVFKNITIINATSGLEVSFSNPYNITLSANDNFTIWCNFGVVGGIEPYTYARFIFNPSNPLASNTTVYFNGTLSVSNEPIYRYLWDFGDNQTATSVCTSHIYNNPGTYIAKLTVTSDAGTDSFAQEITVG